MDHAAALASHSAADLSEPDIGPVAVGDVAQIESGSSFMGGGTDTQGDYLQIGSTAGMGAMWYNQNLYLGGSTNYCTSAPDINSRVGCFSNPGCGRTSRSNTRAPATASSSRSSTGS